MVLVSVPAASTLHESTPQTPTQLLLTSLRSPFVTLEDLEDVLLQILVALDSVPQSHTLKRPFGSRIRTELRGDDVLHVMSTIQHVVLNDILPTWLVPLREGGHEELAEAFFCPFAHTANRHAENPTWNSHNIGFHCKIVTSALPTLLSHLPTLNPKDPGPAGVLSFAVSTLGDIVSLYPVDVVYSALFLTDVGVDPRIDSRRMQDWEDYVRTACSVPGRVANALQGQTKIICSEKLEYGSYFSNVCASTEKIIFRVIQKRYTDTLLQSHNHLLLKLLNLGMFPSRPLTLPSQPSFFSSTLPTIRRHLQLNIVSLTTSDAAPSQYSSIWSAVLRSLPQTSQHTFLVSLFGALDCQVGRDTSTAVCGKVGECARLLRGVVGKLGGADDGELWSAVSAVVCGSGRTWDIGVARAVVCWIADPVDESVDEGALGKLLDATIALWTNPENIRHSLLSQHRYTSSLLLLTLASFPPSSSVLNRLALSSPFVASISMYLGHLDADVRRCGMLVAEVVAKRCGKTLDFGGWEGTSVGLEWARAMRWWKADWMADGFQVAGNGDNTTDTRDEVNEEGGALLFTSDPTKTQTQTAPKSSPGDPLAPDSDDDSLQGYDSPASSRSPSPTPSDLAEIEKDPTLRVGRPKPVARPVYLAQLAALLRAGGSGEEGGVEKMEIGLAHVEGLVRRKKGFGVELEENAVELTIVLTGLKNNFGLEGFDEKRQGALNALVECCPQKAAMTLVEQFFTNQYSIAQRFVMLTALALGGRVLTGLPVPPSRAVTAGVKNGAFPSKILPPALHRRYATVEEMEQAEAAERVGSRGGEVQRLVSGITGPAMQLSKEEVEEAIPEVVRERRLRLGTTARSRITEMVDSHTFPTRNPTSVSATPDTTFTDVAAEHFIMPLVNHMWLHLRDVETRTRARMGTGGGTGIILGSMVLAQYLGTLAVLVHASRHAPAFLGVIVPGAMEVAVALGRRGGDGDEVDLARGEGSSSSREGGLGEGAGDELVKREAAVLTAALEVVLVALDASVELDWGRTLGLEHTALLLGVGEWAGGVLAAVGGGRRMSGGGGAVEGRLGGAAAGIVVKVEKVVERWGRSMVGI